MHELNISHGAFLLQNPEKHFFQEILDGSGLTLIDSTPLEPFRHTFTHFQLDISPIKVTVVEQHPQIAESDTYCWYDPNRPEEIGLTRPVSKLLENPG